MTAMHVKSTAFAVIVSTIICAGTASAATTIRAQRVASDLELPVGVTAPPNDTSRLFIVGRHGVIQILDLGSMMLNATPFLDITSQVAAVSTTGERGLLSLAFDPNYDSNGFFYVYYSDTAGGAVVSRFTVSGNPDVADPSSEKVVLTQSEPEPNHNGGCIRFGPLDHYLYIGLGDGGGAFDQHGTIGNGQNLMTKLGKLLRIDVDVDDHAQYAIPPDNPFVDSNALDEIWAWGLRNPWQYSFDRLTGDLFIGDVGQNAVEELDFQPAESTGGENYGWRCLEGASCTGQSGCSCSDSSLTAAIHTYSHASGNCTVIGGYVYRGCDIPDLRGTYFFADFCTAKIWSLRYNGTVTEFTDRTSQLALPATPIQNIVAFGEDAAGELYIVDQCSANGGCGEVFKIIPRGTIFPAPPNDFDNNGVIDDFDLNGFVQCHAGPDSSYGNCLCDVFDNDDDNTIDLADFQAFQLAYGN